MSQDKKSVEQTFRSEYLNKANIKARRRKLLFIYEKGYNDALQWEQLFWIGFVCWTIIPKLRYLYDHFKLKLLRNQTQYTRHSSLLAEVGKLNSVQTKMILVY